MYKRGQISLWLNFLPQTILTSQRTTEHHISSIFWHMTWLDISSVLGLCCQTLFLQLRCDFTRWFILLESPWATLILCKTGTWVWKHLTTLPVSWRAAWSAVWARGSSLPAWSSWPRSSCTRSVAGLRNLHWAPIDEIKFVKDNNIEFKKHTNECLKKIKLNLLKRKNIHSFVQLLLQEHSTPSAQAPSCLEVIHFFSINESHFLSRHCCSHDTASQRREFNRKLFNQRVGTSSSALFSFFSVPTLAHCSILFGPQDNTIQYHCWLHSTIPIVKIHNILLVFCCVNQGSMMIKGWYHYFTDLLL